MRVGLPRMHRKKTRFAARVRRVATAIERRGVVATYELHDRLLANRSARRRYAREPPVLDPVQQGVVEKLDVDGFAVLPFGELLQPPERWRALDEDAARFT